jgi:hypothetical protein
MKPITVPKDELIQVIETNRDKHRTVFNEAMLGYAKEAETILQTYLNDIRMGKVRKIQIILDQPEDHTRDYDRVLGMLRMDIGDTFELDEQSYKQYVDDDWTWKRAWIDTSTQYAAASVYENYHVGE